MWYFLSRQNDRICCLMDRAFDEYLLRITNGNVRRADPLTSTVASAMASTAAAITQSPGNSRHASPDAQTITTASVRNENKSEVTTTTASGGGGGPLSLFLSSLLFSLLLLVPLLSPLHISPQSMYR